MTRRDTMTSANDSRERHVPMTRRDTMIRRDTMTSANDSREWLEILPLEPIICTMTRENDMCRRLDPMACANNWREWLEILQIETITCIRTREYDRRYYDERQSLVQMTRENNLYKWLYVERMTCVNDWREWIEIQRLERQSPAQMTRDNHWKCYDERQSLLHMTTLRKNDVYVCIHVYMNMHVCMYICIFMYTYICVCMYTYICIYIYAYRWIVGCVYECQHCNTLQHTATHCNALQHTATHNATHTDGCVYEWRLHWLHSLVDASRLFRLQRPGVLQYVAAWCSVVHYVAVRCSVLQCVVLWYSVLQRAAVLCSVLQRDAV